MKVTLICVGKTDEKYIEEGIAKYVKRLTHYVKFNLVIIPDIKNNKNMTNDQQKDREAESILKHVTSQDKLILLDERGKGYTSVEFAHFLDKNMTGNVVSMVFVIGGPYGFNEVLYNRAGGQISLSRMTFSHQMVRLFFVEQLYRSYTIMRGEPYHHE